VGPFYALISSRVEFDDDGEPYPVNSFWPEDLKHVATVTTQCRIFLQENTDAFEAKGSAVTKRFGKRKPRPASSSAE
jgi:hypothetical protein